MVAVVLNLVFVADLVVNFVVLGAKTIWKEKKYLYYELLLQVFGISYFIFIITETYQNSLNGYFTDISLLFLMRNVRAVSFASEVQSMRLMMQTT